MSLRTIAALASQASEEEFDRMIDHMGDLAPDPERGGAVPPKSGVTASAASGPVMAGPDDVPHEAELSSEGADASAPPPAPPPLEPAAPMAPAPEAPAVPPPPFARIPVLVAPPGDPEWPTDVPVTPPDPGFADPPPAAPLGLERVADALILSPEERVALLASLKIDGSVTDAGPAADLLAGKHPRPSIASQREIDRMNRLRLGDLIIGKPVNWPEFMTYPTDLELRGLRKGEITHERIAEFEQVKQRQADEMEARAREINSWIFTYGTMRLNERAQISRARNRDGAIRKRSVGPDGKVNPDLGPVSDVTDEELYKDRFYGIRFASLLNPHPDHLSRMRSAPVASWGHDQLITLDGGRIQARGDELVVRSSSLQAAQMLVMEARSRGWETLRVSGNNEFCAAVKRAAKEAGMGAIIHRRGPLGIGPFSRPEVIMPALPGSVMPRMAGATEAEQKARQEAAPQEDREAAERLLSAPPRSGTRPAPRPRTDQIAIEDPMRAAPPAGPSGPEPA